MNKISFKTLLISFFFAIKMLAGDALSAQTVWLDQLDLSQATQGWGIPKKTGRLMTTS